MRIFNIKDDHLDYEFSYHIDEKKSIKDSIDHKSSITIDDLRRIALWKYDRIINIDDDFLLRLYSVVKGKNISIDDDEVKHIIMELVSFEGVGFPLASSILKFINPDVFPIIDIRAYRAIYGKKLYYSQYCLSKYIDYTKELYKIADYLGVPLSDVDEKLYVFDKNHNGKI